MDSFKTLEEQMARRDKLAKSKAELSDLGWKVLFTCIFFPLIVYSGGYAGSHIWNWFAVPVLHVSALTISQAIALSFVTNFFCKSAPVSEKDPKFWTLHLKYLSRPWLYLFTAWCAKYFLTL